MDFEEHSSLYWAYDAVAERVGVFLVVSLCVALLLIGRPLVLLHDCIG